jgi:O-antigen/teichoic acid export membrane protein
MYRVFNEDHIGTYFAIIYNLILYLGTALLLYFFNSSPNDIAIFYLLIVNLSTISTFLFLKRKYKNIDLIHFDFKEIRNFLFRSSYYLLYKISTFLSINLPVILISILNQSNLLVFTLNRTLSNLQGQFINVAHSSLIQNITNNALNFELTKSFFIFSMNIMFAVSSLMSFIIFLLYEHILFLWLDYGENSNVQQILNYEVMKLLLIYTVIYNLWKSATVFVTSINKHESLSLIYLIYSIVFIIVVGASLHFSNIFIMLKLMIIMEVALLFYITKYVIQRVLEINISKLAEVLILNLLPILISIICITFFSELVAIIFVILAYVLYLKFTIKSNKHIYTTFFK